MRTEQSNARRPWLVSAVLMLAATVFAVRSTWRAWAPCHGSMLGGTALRPLTGDDLFTPACLERMDDFTGFAYGTEPTDLGSGAALDGLVVIGLLVLAWSLPVLFGPWRRRWSALLLLPALAGVALMVRLFTALSVGVGPVEDHDVIADIALWLDAVGLFAVLVMCSLSGISRRRLVQYGLLWWGATAAGVLHLIGDYVVLGTLNEANWDSPPGTGFATAAVIALSGAGLVVATLWPTRTTAPDLQPEPVSVHV